MNSIIADKLTTTGVALAMALSGTALLAGCATTGSSNLGRVMDSPQLERLFAQPFSATYVTTSNGTEYGMQYQSDGSQTLMSDSVQDKGNWRIHNNQYCAKWESLRSGEEGCFTFSQLTPDIYTLSDNNANITGRFNINPATLLEEELNTVFTGNTFIGGDANEFGWSWTFNEDGTAVSGTENDWPEQTWAIEGDRLCRTRNGERPCVTVYRFGGLYQLGLPDSDKRESWWIHPVE